MVGITHQQYLDVASARDAESFKSRLEALVSQLGFPLMNATLVVEAGRKRPAIAAIRNTPDEFADQPHDGTRAARDPVLQRLKVSSAPFVYNQDLYVAHGAGDLWEEQARFGYRSGVSMALHLSGGRHFLFGVDRPDPLPDDPERNVRLMADLQLLAIYAQETAVRLLMPRLSDGEQIPPLTPREQEILKWVLEGKSNSVIGQILNISVDTVNYHLRSAMRKFDVASKHQAAARARALGML